MPEHHTAEQMRQMLKDQVRKKNIALAATLENALSWEWKKNRLTLSFASGFETDMVKKGIESLKQTSSELGFPLSSIEVHSRPLQGEEQKEPQKPRTELIGRIFFGNIMEG